MAVRNALPFEFPYRWGDVRRFFGKLDDEAVDYLDQRDRDLEDYLATLDDGVTAGANDPQLLCMSASADSIASGGDYVTFGSILSRHQFSTVSGAGSSWTHPVGGVYTITYEHAWDSYTGGGTIQLEIDGVVSEATTLASSTSGSKGRASLSYVAAEGSVGKVKVTQSSGSAQTCAGTVWVAIPDPAETGAAGTAEVILFIDGVQVAAASGANVDPFTSATLLLGEDNNASLTASTFTYDEVTIVKNAAQLLGNTGFESALAGGSTTAVSTGNWSYYMNPSATGTTPQRVGSPVHTGSWAAQIEVNAGTNQNRYVYQDVSIAPGDFFDLTFQVYPTGSGSQHQRIIFDWDRTGTYTSQAAVHVTPTETSFEAFGLSGSGPALTFGAWSEVTLRVAVAA